MPVGSIKSTHKKPHYSDSGSRNSLITAERASDEHRSLLVVDLFMPPPLIGTGKDTGFPNPAGVEDLGHPYSRPQPRRRRRLSAFATPPPPLRVRMAAFLGTGE